MNSCPAGVMRYVPRTTFSISAALVRNVIAHPVLLAMYVDAPLGIRASRSSTDSPKASAMASVALRREISCFVASAKSGRSRRS